MTRLELANQLIEGQPAFHFAFIPELLVRAERFELLNKLILSQPPLPIGLRAPADCRMRNRIADLIPRVTLRNPHSAIRNLVGTGGGIRTHTV